LQTSDEESVVCRSLQTSCDFEKTVSILKVTVQSQTDPSEDPLSSLKA
jgi:hypothetical protein